MARLTRSLLKALGIEDEDKQDEIIAAHREGVDSLKAERDKLKEDAEKTAALQADYDKIKKQLDDAGLDPYKAQWEEIKKEFEEYKKGVEAKAVKMKKTDAYRGLLRERKISEKRIDAILKLSGDEIEKLQLDDDGGVKDKDAALKYIDDAWSDFKVTDEHEGQNMPKPPVDQDGSDTGKSRAAAVAAKFYAARYGVSPENGGNKQ